jgi:FMN phosphatase YigB (HAD superfamily)
VGSSKSSAEFFQNVIEKLAPVLPQEIMFWDDDEKNLGPAKEADIYARFYQNFNEFEKEIVKIKLLS